MYPNYNELVKHTELSLEKISKANGVIAAISTEEGIEVMASGAFINIDTLSVVAGLNKRLYHSCSNGKDNINFYINLVGRGIRAMEDSEFRLMLENFTDELTGWFTDSEYEGETRRYEILNNNMKISGQSIEIEADDVYSEDIEDIKRKAVISIPDKDFTCELCYDNILNYSVDTDGNPETDDHFDIAMKINLTNGDTLTIAQHSKYIDGGDEE